MGGASGFTWDDVNSRLGLGQASPSRKFHISGEGVPIRMDSTENNAIRLQMMGSNGSGAGILFGTKGTNDFALEQTEATTSTINTNLYVSQSGEMYLPRLGGGTTSYAVYFDDSTGELSYGAAATGGGSTSPGGSDGQIQLTITGHSEEIAA